MRDHVLEANIEIETNPLIKLVLTRPESQKTNVGEGVG